MTDLADPAALVADAPRVRDALDAAGWSAAALDDLLGGTHRTHLDRDELAPLLRRTRDGGPLAVLARALVVGDAVTPQEARAAGLPESWLRPDGTAAVRLQPVVHGGVEVQVPHDPGRAATGVAREQVLGVGAASLTLAAATPRDPVGRALDLGTGSGVQALLLDDHAGDVVATDRNPRAVALTRLAAALAGTQLDAREGDLLEPVAGERFDLVVSNPPFVISPGARYTYRDAGLPADEVCRRLVGGLPALLADDGVAVLLANWLHVEGEDGDERVRSWFGDDADGWVVQRELAAPEDYVTAWLRDGVLHQAWRLREDVRLHSTGRPGDGGWWAERQWLQQEAGLRWSGEVDAHGATLLAGCDGRTPLDALLAVLASATGLTDAEAAEQVVPVVERLVEQGFLVP